MNPILISRYLQVLRKQHYLTQEALAETLGVTRQAVSRWETGAAVPDPELLLGLSRLYGITINEILEPNVKRKPLEDFEKLPEADQQVVREVLSGFDKEDIVKASMGASPGVYEYLREILPDIDFEREQALIGRIRVEEVEQLQESIVSMFNLTAE